MKRIVLSGSSRLLTEIIEIKTLLEKQGHSVINYPIPIPGDFLTGYPQVHTDFYKSITECDVLLACNFPQHGQQGYIGPSSFAEISFAIAMNLLGNVSCSVTTLFPISTTLPYSEELLLWSTLGWIKEWKI